MIGLSSGTNARFPALLAIVMALTLPLVVSPKVAEAAAFTDVPTGHWAAGPIEELAAVGVLKGVGGGLFQPDRTMTRAEYLAALLRTRSFGPEVQAPVDQALGGTGSGAGSSVFTDVLKDAWYRPHAVLAYRLAITEGPGNGRLRPSDPVIREEVAAMAVRASGWTGRALGLSWSEAASILKAKFKDWGGISEAERPYVAVAVRDGLVTGFPDGTFGPGRTCARAEVAAILARVRKAAPPPAQTVAIPTGKPPSAGGAAPTVSLAFGRKLTLTATAYGPNAIDNYPWSADLCYLGLHLREGIVAVDPTVIPLGTHLYVEGYGYAVAADTGGAIVGDRIDLLIDKPRDQVQDFGIQKLTVYIVD